MPEGRREIWLSVPGDSLDPSLWIGGTTRRFGSAGLAGPRPAQHLCRVCSGGNQVRLVAGFSIALPKAPGLFNRQFCIQKPGSGPGPEGVEDDQEHHADQPPGRVPVPTSVEPAPPPLLVPGAHPPSPIVYV